MGDWRSRIPVPYHGWYEKGRAASLAGLQLTTPAEASPDEGYFWRIGWLDADEARNLED